MNSNNKLTLSHNKKNNLWKFYATSFYILIFIVIFIALFYTKSLLYKNSDDQSINANAMSSGNNLSNEFRCEGNPSDKCVFAPSIDFWPSGSEDNITSGDFPAEGPIVMKNIGGVISAINGNSIEIETKSNRHFDITFPIKAVTWWNSERSANYDGFKVGIGDVITVWYREKNTDSATTISSNQIYRSSIAIKAYSSKEEATQPIQHYDSW